VDDRCCEQEVAAQSRVDLDQLAAQGGYPDRVFEQAAGVGVVAVGCRRVRP
jgi:hypothetical protein